MPLNNVKNLDAEDIGPVIKDGIIIDSLKIPHLNPVQLFSIGVVRDYRFLPTQYSKTPNNSININTKYLKGYLLLGSS